MSDLIALHDGTVLGGVHSADECLLEHCCIHNPSNHPLREAPLAWMGGSVRSMSRVCDHGFHHPDPDGLRFKLAVGDFRTVEAISSVHLMEENCDGCCQEGGAADA